jgi:adenylate cyclase
MSHLSIRLLGPLQVRVNGESVSDFASDKVRALLAHLSSTPDRPHRREALTGLLWPEFPERSARSSLRNALANLRRVIGDSAASPPFLYTTRQTIQFNGQSDYWLDADTFESLLATVPTTSEALEEAVSLVRGSFLEGFTLADAAPFEEWLLLRREQLGRQMVEALDSLAAIHEGRGAYEQALTHTRRRVELEPWQEDGQRQLMRLLVGTGRRAEALAQYEAHRRVLAEELSVEPAPETTRLYELIRNDELELPTVAPERIRDSEPAPRLPGFLEQETDAVKPPVFVARERELSRMTAHLDETLAGHGHVVFVTGGPGRGKTALLTEFGRRAIEANPELLVATGSCNAYSGVGDPYLPFRDVMAMLTGDVEARWLAGAVSTAQARRLWNALPFAVQSLLHHGPHVTGSLVAGKELVSRAALWCAAAASGPHSATWLHGLRRRVEHRRADPERTEQSYLFQQLTNLLRNLAETHPLLLVLDDLQWADTASISLLFHLGRRLEGTRILIAGAYRAEEVSLGRLSMSSEQVEQHPLDKVLHEFKRTFGDVWLDLADVDEVERRRFVDALLGTEPNRFGDGFRRLLTARAGGNPLFTVELVRAMQARGDLIQDRKGFWTEGPVLDWETLPVRVEGAIEARIGRLEPELREILSVASVEGEDFAVQVVAHVLGMEEGVLLPWLAQDLAGRHRLVREQAEVQIGPRRFSRFKFGHALVQNYLYQQLSRGERRLLHGRVAAALESCYGERVDEFAVQLAHHHDRAGDDGRALYYFTRAAENAHRVYANDEAYTHYTRAIEATEKVSVDAASVIRPYLGRALVCQTLGDFEGALADYESALQLAGSTGERAAEHSEWRALLDLGRLWASRDYNRAHHYFQRALDLAHRIGDPAVLAGSLNWMGNWYLNQETPRAGIEHHREALEIFEQAGDRRGLAATLDLLGIASLLGGDITAGVGYYDRAIPLFRELDDQPSLASSLTGRGHAGCSTYTMLTLVSSTVPIHPWRDFEEAIRIAREIGSPAGEAWVLWSQGLLHIVQGRYGQAMEAIHSGADIASQIGHREWIVANGCALGVLYLELLAPAEARRQLEPALALAEELRSRAMIHWATGALAAAYCLRDDRTKAQMLLESVLSAETPMDAMYKRYCWARRAELALAQGNPSLALDITDRLIASAPGMSPGRVITFLWKLKGDALIAMGHTEEAHTLLQAAAENAQATGERFLLWRIHTSLGRLYRALRRQSEAEEQLSTARKLADELADTVPTGELRNVFLQRAHERIRSPP